MLQLVIGSSQDLLDAPCWKRVNSPSHAEQDMIPIVLLQFQRLRYQKLSIATARRVKGPSLLIRFRVTCRAKSTRDDPRVVAFDDHRPTCSIEFSRH